jgi:integrative and conjugative element protein (TIGR02256 family)
MPTVTLLVTCAGANENTRMRALRYNRTNGGKLKLDSGPLGIVLNYKQVTQSRPEAGGLLLGRHIIDSQDLVIDAVTVPHRGDMRTRYGFRRESRWHQKELQRQWLASNGTCTYLGEWHTHPEPVPSPSTVDLHNWQDRVTTDVFEGDSLLFMIVGTEVVRIWEARRDLILTRPIEPLTEFL